MTNISLNHCAIHNIDYETTTIEIHGFKLSTGCPECDKETEKIENEEKARAEKEKQLAVYKSMNIEPMYYESTIDNFIATNQEQQIAKKTISGMIETKRGKLIMIGKNGTGKTHLGISAIKKLGGKIYTMYEISVMIRQSYSSNSARGELQIVDDLASIPMLVIDEIGRTKGSDAETNWLSSIIDKRHTRKLPLILISNKHTMKTCPVNSTAGCKDCLENYISEDIISRFREDGVILTFSGSDYRIEKRKICETNKIG